MIRLSIPVRQALSRLSLPVLVTAAFGLMLLGKADAVLAERMRMALADALSPIYGAMAPPLQDLRTAIDNVTHIFTLASDNARLRRENAVLRKWQAVALALDAENTTLKANLHWIPQPDPGFVTAPVVADAGGAYARAVLLSAGPHHSIKKGEVALDDRGLVGRVTDVGARTVRVLLITDLNSRIPVMLEGSRARAILAGTNGARPRLMYWPEGTQPAEGERVITSSEAGAFPAGLPVGTVHYSSSNVAEVEPFARLDRLEMVRLFDYSGTAQIDPSQGPEGDRRRPRAGLPRAEAPAPVTTSGPMPATAGLVGLHRADR